MFIKLSKNRQAWVSPKNGNLKIECNGDLKIDEFLNLEFFYGQKTKSKTRYDLEDKIKEYGQQISDLQDIQEAYKVTLAIHKYKEHEANIEIKEHQDFPF